MRTCVTGCNGFVGSHLAEFLLAHGATVYGLRRSWRSSMDNVAHLGDRVRWLDADLTDAHAVESALRVAAPDVIFHLAAHSYVQSSWAQPAATFAVNLIGTSHLLEAARRREPMPRIIFASSSEAYGRVEPEELPITEDQPLRPLSPYAVSKAAADYACYQAWRSYGLPVVRLRVFNCEGPRRGEVFMPSNFAKQIAAGAASGAEPVLVHVGNLDAVRDLTDVRDVVRAYWLAAERGEPGEVYNIASGVGYSAERVLDMLAEIAGVRVMRRYDPTRYRPSDVPRLVGDASKAKRDLGWEATIPIGTTLRDLYAYWRERVGR